MNKASQDINDANEKLNGEMVQFNAKLESGMNDFHDKLTEQKNDQNKMMNELTALTDNITDTIKDIESKNDQKLQGTCLKIVNYYNRTTTVP